MKPTTRTALLLTLLGVAAVGSARAESDTAIDSDEMPAVRTANVDALAAPRLVRSDREEATPSAPGFRGSTNEVGYRWWISRGRADLGLGLGMVSYVDRPLGVFGGPSFDNSGRVVASGTVVTLGMRYRTSDRSAVYADAAGLRGPGGIEGADGAVVGKVGLELKSAKSMFNISYGGLGMRLGDARMTVRLRRGGLGLFMRRQF